MVPGKDGLEICRTIRQTAGLASVPVIFLTAKSSEADRVLGLELGADDYIAKPFSPRELVARVKAVLRRFERPLPPSPLKVGEIEIDPSAMTLTVRGQPVATTATEFRLLDYFARHKGRVFSATTFSTPSGATPPTSRRVRSTFTSAASAKKSSPTRRTRVTSRPCAAPATASSHQSEAKVKIHDDPGAPSLSLRFLEGQGGDFDFLSPTDPVRRVAQMRSQ